MKGQGVLFDLPPTEGKTLVFKPARAPFWTENKAKLIARYLYYFVLITKHGAYVDGFAAPQEREHTDSWSAKLVLESKPPFLREFWLCDVDPVGVGYLKRLAAEQPAIKNRSVHVVAGDFNRNVQKVLVSSNITDSTAAFCLLDQRTFDREWKTLEALAAHKQTNKIELFYFLASGWLDRAIAATTVNTAQIGKWWGNDDWGILQKMGMQERANVIVKRFRQELGYTHAYAWPIYDRGSGGRVMYHMIHATDHPEAPKIMHRAYRNATKAYEPVNEIQLELLALFGKA